MHARQQTLAMLDTATGEVVGSDSQAKATTCESFIAPSTPGAEWVSEATGSMQWFLNLMEELQLNAKLRSSAQIRAAEPRKQKRQSARCRVDSEDARGRPLSGDLVAFEGAAGFAVFVATKSSSGSACGHEYKMRCSPLPWRMVYDEHRPMEPRRTKQDRLVAVGAPIPPIGGASCRRCTRSSKRRSRN